MNQKPQKVTISLIVVLILLIASAPVRANSDELLPDLQMGLLSDLGLQGWADGRRVLRFTSRVVNVGSGPFMLHGRRAADSPIMTNVDQHVRTADGGVRIVPTPSLMEYAGDGHDHWHVRDLQLFELERLDDGTKTGFGAKRGFCFFDDRPFQLSLPNAPQGPRYTGCGYAGNTEVAMGLSVGWVDTYSWDLPNQFVDVTGLQAGRYRLWATADPANWYHERFDSNNTTWVDFRLEQWQVKVERTGPLPRTAARCFNQPGIPDCIAGRFEQFWEQHGGLPVFGYPISVLREVVDPASTETYQVQDFERFRFEYHPTRSPRDAVFLGRMGDDRLQGQGYNWRDFPAVSDGQADCRFFPETGHSVCNQEGGIGFKSYWEGHGLQDPSLSRWQRSLALFGLPLSEPFLATNADGATVLMQWFERARFEYHPDNPAQFKVQLGLLGREALAVSPVPAPIPVPAQRIMPDLHGMNEIEAKNVLRDLGIAEVIVDYQYRDDLGDLFDQIPPSTVVSHIPPPGARLTEPPPTVILGVRAP